MKNSLLICISAVIVFVSGCAAIKPSAEQLPITTERREFIYEFSIPNKSKNQLFKSARNYLASNYENSKHISRVEDEEQGTIIAKAISPWKLSTGSPLIPYVACYSKYEINFIAKDGKARLRLFLNQGAVPPCGWDLPPKRDYPQIISEFESIAKELGESLNGNSSINRLSDF